MADTKTGMIQANELRIGNLVKNKYGDIGQVDIVWLRLVTEGEIFEPIPLTEEILLKCGFEKKVNYVKGMTIQDGIAFFDDNEFGHDKEDEIECKYLHQLQNLYFALTGQELTIEL